MKFLPHQLMCEKCQYLKRNCDHLKFDQMKPVGEYSGVSILVKCTDYKKRIKR